MLPQSWRRGLWHSGRLALPCRWCSSRRPEGSPLHNTGRRVGVGVGYHENTHGIIDGINDLVLRSTEHRLTVVTNRTADSVQNAPKVVAEVQATEALLTAVTSGLCKRTAEKAHATGSSEQRPVHLPASTSKHTTWGLSASVLLDCSAPFLPLRIT